MGTQILIFGGAVWLLIRGAALSAKSAVELAENYRLSKYAVGFIVVAVISILPETFVAVNASLAGESSFGLSVLFGSNVADLTLLFALITWMSGRRIRVEGKILKNNRLYPFILLLPITLGWDGHFSRTDGVVLVIIGCVFYYMALRVGMDESLVKPERKGRLKSLAVFTAGMTVLLAGAHWTVSSAVEIARLLNVSSIVIGMLVVGLGTTMPEMLFSLKAVKTKDDSLAVGDILGTVLADATLVVGILALAEPFFFPQKIIYVTGFFMVLASIILIYFMESDRMLSRKEALFLFLYWIVFVASELLISL